MSIVFFSNSFSTASQQFLPSFDSKPRLMSLLPGHHKIEGFVPTSEGQFAENSVVVIFQRFNESSIGLRFLDSSTVQRNRAKQI
jgi:hypothetical protein